ncbi:MULTISPECIES: glyoxalase/bleomycin resistance/extradiol dioxygenase family protein [unclassified Rhodococcus (in: high G+C Gram-positive bacteria)]|uniref:glyoxalase/bleomycin resistance/extradiol dioxygenase family protein n=1 Tax=unclassified Rhodococcus (in: high G+C Gram-positive bacteria) TaxID=192944 RepID=UPI0006F64A12|nr:MULTISPECIES: glyoxalase/bleomycin resistance/extradiol dioxygenase family protein [unclassified Rhodococcus (in: high G+C Gram-positive bacteria)]KQU36554.1 bleomycin resistance protein [Rhodococcus sp. Leaf225]KQU47569.1 bleomycin resistance protein [Rhodococcus sp. Leaf258]
MTVITALHINLRGNAREALEFYQSVFGGELVAFPYGDTESGQGPTQSEQIAWGEVSTPGGFRVMAYDIQDSLPYNAGENAFYSALRSHDADEITAAFEGLSPGATVLVPLGPVGFSPLYGKLVDKFGVVWILDVIPQW